MDISVSENIGIPYQYGLGESGFAACFDGLRQPRGKVCRIVEAFVQGGETDGGFRILSEQFSNAKRVFYSDRPFPTPLHPFRAQNRETNRPQYKRTPFRIPQARLESDGPTPNTVSRSLRPTLQSVIDIVD